jgi:hypothetical protein
MYQVLQDFKQMDFAIIHVKTRNATKIKNFRDLIGNLQQC